MGIMIRPKFYIYDTDGNKVKSIKKAYIKKIHITHYDYKNKQLVDSGKTYSLVIDDKQIETELAFANHAYCIVSFQQHNFGNYAVARLTIKEDSKKEKVA